MSEYQDSFRADAQDLLTELETALLELETRPDNQDLVERVFRAMHTIKGNARVVGFDDIAGFTHELETVFDLIRKGQVAFSRKIGKLAFQARDQILFMIDGHFGDAGPDEREKARILRELATISSQQAGAAKKAAREKAEGLCQTLLQELPALETGASPTASTFVAVLGRLTDLRRTVSLFGTDLDLVTGSFCLAYEILQKRSMPCLTGLPKQTAGMLGYLPTMIKNAEADQATLLNDPMLLIESMQKPLEITAALKALFLAAGISPDELVPKTSEPSAKAAGADQKTFTYQIVFRPLAEFALTGMSLGDVQAQIQELGTLTVSENAPVARENPAGIPGFEAFLTTPQEMAVVQEVFGCLESCAEVEIRLADSGKALAEDGSPKKLGEILLERGEISPDHLDQALEQQRGNVSSQPTDLDWDSVTSVRRRQKETGRGSQRGKRNREAFDFMRISLPRLNELVNLIGELVAQQTRLRERAGVLENRELAFFAEEVDRLVNKMRESAMKIRMEPVGITFFKFNRMVKELARELGKEVEFVTEGAEIELDKATIEAIGDPLVHLIRNTIDHGIEHPDKREQLGKPRKGEVKLIAEHSGGLVWISIKDDGAGLNEERILAKALEKGLIQPNAELSKKEIYQLIFLPGFSTAAQVTTVSGRGTGMDVVKRAIEKLHGVIDISSAVGKGSTFTLKLPLTLAIVEGLLVTIAERFFLFPLAMVQEIVNLDPERMQRRDEQDHVSIRGDLVPFLRLSDFLNLERETPTTQEQLVVCGVEGKRLGFVVDSVIGEHQALIKSLGSYYRDVRFFSGATILGDRTLALILDLPALARAAERLTPA
jgi:two-component system chemotaxis sensor kinase CheA